MNWDKKILCIIPARGGSKGVKRKNIRNINGKPLIGWIIDEAKKSRYIDRTIVSTEDNEILQTSAAFGAEVIERPMDLAGDTASSMDVVFNMLDVLKKQGYIPDFVLLLQCTSPLNRVDYIDEAIETLLKNQPYAESLVSVCKVEHPPWWLKKINENGYLEDVFEYDKKLLTRRQDFPDCYRENGAIYIAKTEKLYQYKGFETENMFPYIMDSESSIDIDTELDLEIADLLMKKNKYR
ncbi:MAG: cytidylyltransferase domain-containing protein [Deltaproteobacteria bacterium]